MSGQSVIAFEAVSGAFRHHRLRVDKHFRLLAAVATLSFSAVSGASAVPTYTFGFSYSGAGVSVTGTLIAVLQSPGEYQIMGITGARNGVNITGLIGQNGFDNNDNLLFLSGYPGYVDTNGFSYATGGVAYNERFIGEGNDPYLELSSFNGNTPNNFSVHGAPAPVPGGGLLSFLALGLAGLAYGRKRIASGMRRCLGTSNVPASNFTTSNRPTSTKRAIRVADGR